MKEPIAESVSRPVRTAAAGRPQHSPLKQTISDTWILTGRELLHWRAAPGAVVIGWLFPVLMALMFGYLFGGAIRVPEGTRYFEFLMPGIFAMAMLFGLETTVIGVTGDASKGVTDRLRSLPIRAAAVVLARCIADMLHTFVGLVILIAAALALGWRWHEGLPAAAAAIGLLLLLRFSLLWIGISIGLAAQGPNATAAVQTVQLLVWPFAFLSAVFVDTASMPVWLGAIADWNPLSATATAARELFGNSGWSAEQFASRHAVGLALLWPLVLTTLFFPLAVRQFRTLGQ